MLRGACTKGDKRVSEEFNEIIKEAAALGYEVNWSPVNQAYFVIIAVPGAMRKMAGVKNTLQEVKEFLDDRRRERNAGNGDQGSHLQEEGEEAVKRKRMDDHDQAYDSLKEEGRLRRPMARFDGVKEHAEKIKSIADKYNVQISYPTHDSYYIDGKEEDCRKAMDALGELHGFPREGSIK